MHPNPQEFADLVTFTEEIVDVKLHFLWSVKRFVVTSQFTGHTEVYLRPCQTAKISILHVWRGYNTKNVVLN